MLQLMVVGKRHEPPGSETEDFTINDTAGNTNFIFILVSLASCSSDLMGMMSRWVQVDAILIVLDHT